MIDSVVHIVAGTTAAVWASWTNQIGGLFLVPRSSMFVGGLAFSLLIAGALAVPRGHGRAPRFAVLMRAIFPRRMVRTASGRADIGYFLFGLLVFALAFGWAFLSADRIATATTHLLTATIGPARPRGVPVIVVTAIDTILLFLAYELAFWFDHYLSHKLPVLWQFHRVHHAAESLSLLTNFRVHPVDTIVFANLVALTIGITTAVLGHLFGAPAVTFGIGGTNILIWLCAIGLTHLQHSHFWVGFGPRWGRVLLGPAHHQIHHSADPRHFDRNFGSSLALWDRLFGTFHAPAATREPLRFGLGEAEPDPHGWKAALIGPFVGAATCLKPGWVHPSMKPARPATGSAQLDQG